MVLISPGWALGLVAILAGVAVVAVLRRVRSAAPPRGSLRGANLHRVRRLPRYQSLARDSVRRATAGLVGTCVLGLGVVLLVAQPADDAAGTAEDRHRDIVLCLDVSGSMVETNQHVVAAYLELAKRLDGERIGLVVFDATAVTVFPLTDDAEFIARHIASTAEMLGTEIPGTTLAGAGTSLIGDGLTSCLQRFDAPDSQRSRTVVLTTDNQTFGRPLFTLEEAGGRAAASSIMVFGVVPADNSPDATTNLADVVRTTGGDVLSLTPGRRTDLDAVEAAVRAQERRSLAGSGGARPSANDVPGTVLGLVGAAVLIASQAPGRLGRHAR